MSKAAEAAWAEVEPKARPARAPRPKPGSTQQLIGWIEDETRTLAPELLAPPVVPVPPEAAPASKPKAASKPKVASPRIPPLAPDVATVPPEAEALAEVVERTQRETAEWVVRQAERLVQSLTDAVSDEAVERRGDDVARPLYGLQVARLGKLRALLGRLRAPNERDYRAHAPAGGRAIGRLLLRLARDVKPAERDRLQRAMDAAVATERAATVALLSRLGLVQAAEVVRIGERVDPESVELISPNAFSPEGETALSTLAEAERQAGHVVDKLAGWDDETRRQALTSLILTAWAEGRQR